ncbi:MAG: 4Fe-4S binding protein [Armatimonadota bacterium]|nr:MAG: 4Fe-4S binding protein [Armatimonadota bacterium]
MCEFCVKHGEGKKWYLQARNYGLDLASDLRRRRFIGEFFNSFDRKWGAQLERMRRLDRAPRVVQSLRRGWMTRRMKRQHFGQVLPLEDVRQVMEIAGSVVCTPCACRGLTRGDKDARFCFGVSISPKAAIAFSEVDESFAAGPETQMTERLEPAQALDMMADFEKRGLVHSVWTFVTPFIAGICNCDRSDCLAMIAAVGHDTRFMFKAEYVAQVDWDQCEGCRACMRQCQFGAIGYSAAASKCVIDQQQCWGCGVCRAACARDGISLIPRSDVPALGW